MKKSFFVAAAALLLISHVASASILVASDNFEQENKGSIAGQSGGSGWAGAWKSALTTASAPKVVNTPPKALGGKHALELTANDNNAAYRVMNTTLSKDVLVDFLFQYSGKIGNNDFLGLWFGNSDGPNIGVKGNCGNGKNACTNDLFARTIGTEGTFLQNSDLTAGITYRVFGHLYKTGGSANYNRFDAWIDPTVTEMSTLKGWDASYAGASTLASFDTIGFRTANLNKDDLMRIDDLKISVVPEPSSIALLGLALLGMASVRRGKRN